MLEAAFSTTTERKLGPCRKLKLCRLLSVFFLPAYTQAHLL